MLIHYSQKESRTGSVVAEFTTSQQHSFFYLISNMSILGRSLTF
jgi:hypothetical protein